MLPPVLTILGILVLIGAIGYTAHVLEKRRTEELSALAPLLGLTYHGADEGNASQILGYNFPLFETGYRGRLRHLLLGTFNQHTIAIFEYSFRRHARTNRNSNNKLSTQTVFFISSENFNLPQCTISPENFFHKLAQYVGYQDIDLPNFPEFSQKFLLRGRDIQLVQSLFTSKLTTFLLEAHPISVELLNRAILIYRADRTLPPETLQNALQDAKRLADLLTSQ